MMHLEHHELFYRESCPYCQKVLAHMAAHGITLELRDTSQRHHADELVRIGGMSQVPCLIIDGKPLYESDDIIAYLEKKVS